MKYILIIASIVLPTIGFCQDTVNFVYQKTKVQDMEDSHLTNEGHKVFISDQKIGKEYNTISITIDTSAYEIHWKGFKRELFKAGVLITKINRVIVPFGVKYEYTVGDVTYSFKKDKEAWVCYDGEEKVMAVDFYKKEKIQIVQLSTIKSISDNETLKVLTLYCADDLIRTKKTTFGKAWRAAGVFRLVR